MNCSLDSSPRLPLGCASSRWRSCRRAVRYPQGVARAVSASYQIAVPVSRLPGLEERIQRLLSASTSLVPAPNRSAPIDLRASLLALALGEGVLEMRLKTDPGGSAGPRDVLAALGLEDLEHEGTVLTRTDVEIDS